MNVVINYPLGTLYDNTNRMYCQSNKEVLGVANLNFEPALKGKGTWLPM